MYTCTLVHTPFSVNNKYHDYCDDKFVIWITFRGKYTWTLLYILSEMHDISFILFIAKIFREMYGKIGLIWRKKYWERDREWNRKKNMSHYSPKASLNKLINCLKVSYVHKIFGNLCMYSRHPIRCATEWEMAKEFKTSCVFVKLQISIGIQSNFVKQNPKAYVGERQKHGFGRLLCKIVSVVTE